MAVHTTHLQKNFLSNQSIWRDAQDEAVKPEIHPMESGDVQKEASLGRVLRSVGKGIKTGLMAHGLAMTSGKM